MSIRGKRHLSNKIKKETEQLGGVPEVLKNHVVKIGVHHYVRVKYMLRYLEGISRRMEDCQVCGNYICKCPVKEFKI